MAGRGQLTHSCLSCHRESSGISIVESAGAEPLGRSRQKGKPLSPQLRPTKTERGHGVSCSGWAGKSRSCLAAFTENRPFTAARSRLGANEFRERPRRSAASTPGPLGRERSHTPKQRLFADWLSGPSIALFHGSNSPRGMLPRQLPRNDIAAQHSWESHQRCDRTGLSGGCPARWDTPGCFPPGKHETRQQDPGTVCSPPVSDKKARLPRGQQSLTASGTERNIWNVGSKWYLARFRRNLEPPDTRPARCRAQTLGKKKQ